MTKDEYALLVEMQIVGGLAKAFLHRNIAPTNEQMVHLLSRGEMTMRDIGEMAYDLDVEVDLVFLPREPVYKDLGQSVDDTLPGEA